MASDAWGAAVEASDPFIYSPAEQAEDAAAAMESGKSLAGRIVGLPGRAAGAALEFAGDLGEAATGGATEAVRPLMRWAVTGALLIGAWQGYKYGKKKRWF